MPKIIILGHKKISGYAVISDKFGEIYFSKEELNALYFKLYLENNIGIEYLSWSELQKLKLIRYQLKKRIKSQYGTTNLGSKFTIEKIMTYYKYYETKRKKGSWSRDFGYKE
jgi:hypothetical protein